MGLTILGLVLNIVLAIYNFISNKRMEKLILKEKDMIRSKVLDIARKLKSYVDIVMRDREIFHEPERDVAHVRIEGLEAEIDNLTRFAEDLKK